MRPTKVTRSKRSVWPIRRTTSRLKSSIAHPDCAMPDYAVRLAFIASITNSQWKFQLIFNDIIYQLIAQTTNNTKFIQSKEYLKIFEILIEVFLMTSIFAQFYRAKGISCAVWRTQKNLRKKTLKIWQEYQKNYDSDWDRENEYEWQAVHFFERIRGII